VPTYLVRFRKTGQFDIGREALAPGEAAIPDVIAPDSTGPASQLQPGRASGPALGQGTAEHVRSRAHAGAIDLLALGREQRRLVSGRIDVGQAKHALDKPVQTAGRRL